MSRRVALYMPWVPRQCAWLCLCLFVHRLACGPAAALRLQQCVVERHREPWRRDRRRAARAFQ